MLLALFQQALINLVTALDLPLHIFHNLELLVQLGISLALFLA